MKLLIVSMTVILYDCTLVSTSSVQELYDSEDPVYVDMVNALMEDDIPVEKMLPLVLPVTPGELFLSKSDGVILIMQLARQGLNGSSILAELARRGYNYASPGIVEFAAKVDSFRQIDADFFDAVVLLIPRQNYSNKIALRQATSKLPWVPVRFRKHVQLMAITCLNPQTLAKTCLEGWIDVQGGPLRIYRMTDAKWQEVLSLAPDTFFAHMVATTPMHA